VETKGKTIKEIGRDPKVSRNTVRKVLRSGETSFEYYLRYLRPAHLRGTVCRWCSRRRLPLEWRSSLRMWRRFLRLSAMEKQALRFRQAMQPPHAGALGFGDKSRLPQRSR
jgi:hypothetical protein